MTQLLTYKSIVPESRSERLVAGLRCSLPPSTVKVYELNPDGSKGKFLREEEPFEYQTEYNGNVIYV